MTSVFSAIVLPLSSRSSSKDASSGNQDISYDGGYDIATRPVVPEEPNLRDLNHALRALTDIFPDVQSEVFREMLTRVSEGSRLEIVTEQLLKNDAKWIQGRFRRGRQVASTTQKECSPRNEEQKGATLCREETFRNEQYKTAVKQALFEEFKGLSHSAVRAVLAEHNHHYTTARNALLGIASKSWKFSVTSFLFRRKTPSLNRHPYVTWITPKDDTRSNKKLRLPKLVSTLNDELNQELSDTLISPAYAKEKEAQSIVDHALAHQLQESEATGAEEEYDCECCYSTVTIHKLAVCDDGGHYICFRCISHTIDESIYGQGWSKSIDCSRGTMRCVAPILNDSGECKGCIPFDLVKLALEDKESSKQTLQKLEQRMFSSSLQDSDLPLVHCPFCSYAEVNDLGQTKTLTWRLRDPREMKFISIWLFLMILSSGGLLLILPFLAAGYLFFEHSPWNPLYPSLLRLATKSRGLRFTCLYPACSKPSCLRCHTLWHDPHTCYSSQLNSLQKALESAQTGAIKRTCPKCQLSFVKSSGCNKLVCPCGYSMCYLCRKELGGRDGEGYDHFCQHFRERGGLCTECERCDLYREEDERVVLQRARDKAEREWWESEGKGMDKEDVRKSGVLRDGGLWDWSAWEGWLDRVVERIVVVRVD